MKIEESLMQRSESKCELCSATENLSVHQVSGSNSSHSEGADTSILLCLNCSDQIFAEKEIQPKHWRCLNDSMWSQVPAIQVMAWRMLKRLSNESWAQDLLDMLYLEDDLLKWAQAADEKDAESTPATLDSNGVELRKGDTVTLIKDLVVKGANFTAKRGTSVRNIVLTSNHEQIEGRVNGTRIVLLTCYLKKSN